MIKLGYEVEIGKEAGISLSHVIATGLTQLSEKTTNSAKNPIHNVYKY
jgi:hypothetical protein